MKSSLNRLQRNSLQLTPNVFIRKSKQNQIQSMTLIDNNQNSIRKKQLQKIAKFIINIVMQKLGKQIEAKALWESTKSLIIQDLANLISYKHEYIDQPITDYLPLDDQPEPLKQTMIWKKINLLQNQKKTALMRKSMTTKLLFYSPLRQKIQDNDHVVPLLDNNKQNNSPINQQQQNLRKEYLAKIKVKEQFHEQNKKKKNQQNPQKKTKLMKYTFDYDGKIIQEIKKKENNNLNSGCLEYSSYNIRQASVSQKCKTQTGKIEIVNKNFEQMQEIQKEKQKSLMKQFKKYKQMNKEPQIKLVMGVSIYDKSVKSRKLQMQQILNKNQPTEEIKQKEKLLVLNNNSISKSVVIEHNNPKKIKKQSKTSLINHQTLLNTPRIDNINKSQRSQSLGNITNKIIINSTIHTTKQQIINLLKAQQNLVKQKHILKNSKQIEDKEKNIKGKNLEDHNKQISVRQYVKLPMI